MIHKMRLAPIPFTATKNGLKLLEVRLNDEKRRHLKNGDTIIFERTDTLEILTVRIKEIRKYESMIKLATCEDFSKTGGIYQNRYHWKDEIDSYYGKTDQERDGLLAIEIESPQAI